MQLSKKQLMNFIRKTIKEEIIRIVPSLIAEVYAEQQLKESNSINLVDDEEKCESEEFYLGENYDYNSYLDSIEINNKEKNNSLKQKSREMFKGFPAEFNEDIVSDQFQEKQTFASSKDPFSSLDFSRMNQTMKKINKKKTKQEIREETEMENRRLATQRKILDSQKVG